MSKVIQGNGSATLQAGGGNVKGLRFNIVIAHDTVNTDVTTAMLDTSKIVLKCNLKRGNRVITIFQDKLRTLAREGAFVTGEWDSLITTTAYVPLLAKGASVKAQGLVTLSIPLHGAISLRDGDSLETEVNVISGAFDAVLNQTTSQCEFDYIYTDTREMGIPVIKSKTFNTGDGAISENLGDNVIRATFINMDKTDNLTASAPVQTFQVSTNGMTQSLNYQQLQAKRTQLFTNITDALKRYQSFLILQEEDSDNVKIQFNLESTNVSAGANALVWRTWSLDPSDLHGAIAAKEEASTLKAAKAGLAVDHIQLSKHASAKAHFRKHARGHKN